jgi:hypothetical protein
VLRTHGDRILTGLPSAEPKRQGKARLGSYWVCGFKLSNLVLGPCMESLFRFGRDGPDALGRIVGTQLDLNRVLHQRPKSFP